MYATRRPQRRTTSRDRVLAAVRALLEEGAFHESTVEQVAGRAGVSRATVYGHFRSRIGLVDAVCDLFDQSPELAAVRRSDDVDAFVAAVVEFWAAEEKLLVQLYGAAAVDPAAADFVQRQRADRYGEVRRLLRHLGCHGAQRFAGLAAITSFETYLELRRHAGRSKSAVVADLRRAAHALLGR
jgi:AcrR family transcriptional regulator